MISETTHTPGIVCFEAIRWDILPGGWPAYTSNETDDLIRGKSPALIA